MNQAVWWALNRAGMAASWEIWLDDSLGNRLAYVRRAVEFSIQRVANDVGAFQLVLPAGIYEKYLALDGMVEFWRRPVLGAKTLVGVGFQRLYDLVDDSSGMEYTVIGGPDQNDLLKRRIIAYAAASAQASMTNQADDLIKEIARDNLGADATDSARDLSGMGVSIAGDRSLGVSITKKFSWRQMLPVMQESALASRQQGTDIYFDMVPIPSSSSGISFELRTYAGQLGADHTFDAASPVIFSRGRGNLQGGRLTDDYTEEANVVYAGGQGEESDREIVEVEDTSRSKASPWNRREAFADARNEDTTAGVTNKGRSVLEESRPKRRFSGTILESAQSMYGVHWAHGDRVTCEFRGMQFDGMIRSTMLGKARNGRDIVQAGIESEFEGSAIGR